MTRAEQDVLDERQRQREMWGDEHDDGHDALVWTRLVRNYNDEATAAALRDDWPTYRSKLVKVAALAIAAVEANDRSLTEERSSAEHRYIADEEGAR